MEVGPEGASSASSSRGARSGSRPAPGLGDTLQGWGGASSGWFACRRPGRTTARLRRRAVGWVTICWPDRRQNWIGEVLACGWVTVGVWSLLKLTFRRNSFDLWGSNFRVWGSCVRRYNIVISPNLCYCRTVVNCIGAAAMAPRFHIQCSRSSRRTPQCLPIEDAAYDSLHMDSLFRCSRFRRHRRRSPRRCEGTVRGTTLEFGRPGKELWRLVAQSVVRYPVRIRISATPRRVCYSASCSIVLSAGRRRYFHGMMR